MDGLSLSHIFEVMEAKKDELGVLDYSASQPSLESIFLAIAEKDITLDRNRRAQLRGGPSTKVGGSLASDAPPPRLALSPPPSAPRSLSPRPLSPRPSFGRVASSAAVEPVTL